MLTSAPIGGARSDRYPWLTPLYPYGRPSVGALMGLCEENYRSLLGLVPGLRQLRGEHRSVSAGMALHLEVVEQAPYTTLLRLTYLFPYDDGAVHRIPQADPDALLRAYHDARQVEVLDLRQTALPLHNQYRYPALDAKWRANLFLSKWLPYCLGGGHRFPCARYCDCDIADLATAFG